MKKLLFTWAFMVGIINLSNSQVFVQYFDGADTSASNSVMVQIAATANNIWQIGKPQKPIFDSAATVPNVIVTDTVNFYPVNNTSVFTFDLTPPFPVGSGTIYALQWKQKLDMTKNKDGGIIEFSRDNGLTWENVFNNPNVYNFFGFDPKNQDTLSTGQYAFSGTDSTWKNIWFCLYSQPFTAPTYKYRFTFKSDSVNNNKEGWMIDNFMAHVTFTHPVNEHSNNVFYNVYPNPAKDFTTIEMLRSSDVQTIQSLQLIDMDGKIINEWNNVPAKYTIDISKYAAGIYFLKAISGESIEKIPLAIMRK